MGTYGSNQERMKIICFGKMAKTLCSAPVHHVNTKKRIQHGVTMKKGGKYYERKKNIKVHSILTFHFRRLVEKLDNMKKNAMGNGSTQCVLCGDEFGLLGASPTFCDDCRKVSCFFVSRKHRRRKGGQPPPPQ